MTKHGMKTKSIARPIAAEEKILNRLGSRGKAMTVGARERVSKSPPSYMV